MKQYWSMTEGVFNCLIDETRTAAFAKAIRDTVQPGDIVLDMGTGSGVLAMLAAKAGAKMVYAAEIDPNNIKALTSTFNLNNFQDQITIVEGDITKIDLPEPIDVIIGELIATALIEELQIPAMNNVLRFAKSSTRVLLRKYDTYIDVVYNNDVFQDFKFNILRYEYPDERELKSVALTGKKLLKEFDFTQPVRNTRVDKEIQLIVNKPGIINAVRLSGTTTFHNDETLDCTFAYSYPLILPIESKEVKLGDVLSVKIKYQASGGLDTLSYDLKIAHSPQSTVHSPQSTVHSPQSTINNRLIFREDLFAQNITQAVRTFRRRSPDPMAVSCE